MSKNYKIPIVAAFIMILLVCIAGVVIVFSKRKITQDDVRLNFKIGNKQIVVKNVLPVTDEVGKKISSDDIKEGIYGYTEFSVESVVKGRRKYEIYATKIGTNNKIDENYVKLYMTDKDNRAVLGFEKNVIPTYKSLKVKKSAPTRKILYQGELGALEKDDFKLKVWLSDSSPIEKEEKYLTFEIGVRVY